MAGFTTPPFCSVATARRLAATTRSVRRGQKLARASGETRSRFFPRRTWAPPACSSATTWWCRRRRAASRLQGADIIFFPTMGGAAIGDDDIGVQALRVRAAENFIWLVVAQRGSGAMIISPQGKIVAQAEGPDGLAIADIDPRGQREGGDALNWQRDMRARLFRERNPEAFRILTDTNPPVLDKVPIDLTQQEAGRIMARALTVGEDEFKQANDLVGSGKTDEAISAFERLRKEYPATWIDRRSQERLAKLQPVALEAGRIRFGPCREVSRRRRHRE